MPNEVSVSSLHIKYVGYMVRKWFYVPTADLVAHLGIGTYPHPIEGSTRQARFA
jgi:hypothetical protein